MVIPGEQPFRAPLPADPDEPQTHRLLVVDGDRGARAATVRSLAAPQRQIDDCGSLATARALLEGGTYQLVLLDARLPDGSGLDLLDWLTVQRRDEAVILLSTEDALDAAAGALRHGADDCVRKPCPAALLQRTVDRTLHKLVLERANEAMSARLRASEKLHRQLVENAPDLIFTLDAEGCFTYLNPRVETLLGFPRDALLHRPFATLLPQPDDAERIAALLAAGDDRSAEGSDVEVRLRRNPAVHGANASVTVALSTVALHGGDHGGPGASGLYGVARDISERKRAEEIIAFQAYHDQLTRLPNRVLFKDRLELAITQAQRRAGALAVMFIDIDRFKLVNDTFGHAEGDALLRAIATRLSTTLRRGDTLARLGGNEFTLLLPDIDHPEDAETIARKVADALAAPFALSAGAFLATASIGIALYPRDGSSAEELIRSADIAMHQIKRGGKNGFRFSDPDLNSHFRERLGLENDLRHALERGEFELHYQPQFSFDSGRIVGTEALLRWNHPLHGQIGPSAFIGLAEELGLIGGISRWVLEEACAQLARWRADGHRELRMSLNLSPHDFDRRDLVTLVTACIARHDLPPAAIELEITESMMMRDTAGAAARVAQLRAAGLSVAIDDFGTGYSALAYLQKFPVSTLKIDRSFVHELGGGTNPIISAITGIARGFDLHLVAEGVEHAEQARTLRAFGCDVMQGYLFAHPAPAAEIGALLRDAAAPCGAG